MQVAIDWELCIGSGQCVAAAPRAFALVRHGDEHRAVLVAPPVDDDALLAVAVACPTMAIRLSREGDAVYPPAGG
jgi:ferredoxin